MLIGACATSIVLYRYQLYTTGFFWVFKIYSAHYLTFSGVLFLLGYNTISTRERGAVIFALLP